MVITFKIWQILILIKFLSIAVIKILFSKKMLGFMNIFEISLKCIFFDLPVLKTHTSCCILPLYQAIFNQGLWLPGFHETYSTSFVYFLCHTFRSGWPSVDFSFQKTRTLFWNFWKKPKQLKNAVLIFFKFLNVQNLVVWKGKSVDQTKIENSAYFKALLWVCLVCGRYG